MTDDKRGEREIVEQTFGMTMRQDKITGQWWFPYCAAPRGPIPVPQPTDSKRRNPMKARRR